MILSILICTIESRKEKFDKLKQELERQISFFDQTIPSESIEVLSICDNKEISVGAKRQRLLELSTGEYVVFIDDDDWISETYLEKIIHAIHLFPDSIGFEIQCDISGVKTKAIASNRYSDWCEDRDGFKYCRTPYHKTPISREIAIEIGYNDIRFGEDYDYSFRLKKSGLIKNEVYINDVMYYYNFKYEDPKIKYGFKN